MLAPAFESLVWFLTYDRVSWGGQVPYFHVYYICKEYKLKNESYTQNLPCGGVVGAKCYFAMKPCCVSTGNSTSSGNDWTCAYETVCGAWIYAGNCAALFLYKNLSIVVCADLFVLFYRAVNACVCGAGAHMCKNVVARKEDTCSPVCYLRPKKWERSKNKNCSQFICR